MLYDDVRFTETLDVAIPKKGILVPFTFLYKDIRGFQRVFSLWRGHGGERSIFEEIRHARLHRAP